MQPGQDSFRVQIMLCLDAEVDASNLLNIRGGGIGTVGADHPKAAILDLKLVVWATTDAFFTGTRKLAVHVVGPDGSLVMEGEVRTGTLVPNSVAPIIAPIKKALPFGSYAVRLLVDGQVVDDLPLEVVRKLRIEPQASGE